MTYTDVFGGNTIYPSDVSYRSITLSEDLSLSWPLETSSEETTARIMDVTASAINLRIILPVASAVSNGQTLLINNVGADTFTVHDNTGTQLISLSAGRVWQIYLMDNTTDAGTWRVFQYGASISSANAASLAGTGITAVGTLLSQSIPVTTFSSDYTAGAADRARMYVWTGSGGTLTLPSASVVGNNWFMYFRNSGSGALTIAAVGVDTVDASATKVLQPGESLILVSSGTGFYTVGFGKSATFAFDYTTVDVAGTGNYTLAGAELNRIAYKFTGILTGDRVVIVPDTIQQYWVTNSTTGAFTLTLKTAAGTGLLIGQDESAIYYCDGTNVVDADSSTVSFPIAINQGGTGAVTASAALINLGGTAVGTALFTVVDEDAAWAVLGPIALVDGGSF